MKTAPSRRPSFQLCHDPDAYRPEAATADATHWVERVLVKGRHPARASEPTRILGQLVRDRIAQGRGDPSAEETGMRIVLEAWHARRSHTLEWIIIALIAVDILIHCW